MHKPMTIKLNKWFILATNFVCVIGVCVLFIIYSNVYHNRLYIQNLENIKNLSQASETIAETYFANRSQHLANIVRYVEQNQFSKEEALKYIDDSNYGSDEQYQLIDADYTGYLVDERNGDEIITLDYSHMQYSDLHSIFDKMSSTESEGVYFAPEFTNNYDALKSFAQYTQVTITNSDNTIERMTLMSVSKTKKFIDTIQLQGEYQNLYTVLIDGKGNYIISNSNFKSGNFFQFLYAYNDLTLDERKELEVQLTGNDFGTYIYLNSYGEECVYTYQKMRDYDWYCVTQVPVNEFTSRSFDYRFTIIAFCILFCAFLIDILWLNSVNIELENSMKHEKEANGAKSEFLSRMSHDIRTPMNAILGLAQLGQNDAKEENERTYFTKIRSSANYLLGLLNDVLDMSRIENGKVEFHIDIVNTKKFYNEIMELLKPLIIERDISVIYQTNDEADYFIYCDKLRMQQVYLNLMSNAIKFSKPGGIIEWASNKSIIEENGIALQVKIRDYGCGMSEEFLKRVFMPFEQEYNIYSKEKPGTGLGLAICKNLVNQMGGDIVVESEVGKGSTFIVSTSHQLAEKPREEEINEQWATQQLEGKRIMLVEDNALNKEIAERLLTIKGMKVTCAENGQIAVDIFRESPPNSFDAILMDMRMPVMDGLEATRQIRAMKRVDAKTVPIIAMTADAYDTDREKSIQAGLNDHLSKPVDVDQIYATLEKYCLFNSNEMKRDDANIENPQF